MKRILIILSRIIQYLGKVLFISACTFLIIVLIYSNISKLNQLYEATSNIPIKSNPYDNSQTNYSTTIEPSLVTKVEIQNVPPLNQLPSLPTGCESTSTAMLLNWAGIDVTKEEIAKALPKGNLPSWHKGKIVGGNPNEVFVGNPFSTSGFGVFHKPIYKIINKYMPNQALDLTGQEFDIILNVVADNRPVIAWATINMETPKVNAKWFDNNGNIVTWRVPEHAVVIIGYTDTHIIVNDPLKGKKIYYDIFTFKTIWETMGKQAVTIK